MQSIKNRVLKEKEIISPHLFLYRPQISSIFSIFQRITGIILTILLFLYIFLYIFEFYFLSFYSFYNLCLFFYSYSGYFRVACIISFVFLFFYHLFNGLKMLFFETEPTGEIVTLEIYYIASFLTLVISFVFTLIFWWILFIN